MTNPEIQARRNIALTIFYAAGAVFVIVSIIVDKGEELLNWRTSLRDEFAFIISILALFYFIPQIFYNKPQFVINKEGIWTRQKSVPSSELYLIPWSKVMYFYVVRIKGIRSTSVLLKLGVEDSKEIAFNIQDFDIGDDRIIEVIKWYSQVYHFIDYGEEESGFFS